MKYKTKRIRYLSSIVLLSLFGFSVTNPIINGANADSVVVTPIEISKEVTIKNAISENLRIAKVATKLNATNETLSNQKRQTKIEDAQKIEAAKKAEEERQAEEAKKAEDAKKAEEAKQAEEAKKAEEAKTATQDVQAVQDTGSPTFGSDGLLIMTSSSLGQQVVNGLLGIPGHSNGSYYHQNGLDTLINQLSVNEAVWVIHTIEGAGFGQTGDGMAGLDTPLSHQTFINNQVNKRFGGSIHALLRAWGTYSYGGY